MTMAAAAASTVRIRAATLQDVASIRNLLQQLGYDVSEVEVARRVGLLERERNHLLLVAADDSDKPLAVVPARRIGKIPASNSPVAGGGRFGASPRHGEAADESRRGLG